MKPFEAVVSADSLRDLQAVLGPDPRTNRFDSLAQRQQRVGEYLLSDSVPYPVRVHFETAKNLYLYAWFVYRFHPVAEKHVLATLEFALRERLAPMFPEQFGPQAKRHPTLRTLIAKAREEKLLTNIGLRVTERLARLRAEHRVSLERIRYLQSNGLTELVCDAAPPVPVPEDYAHDLLKIFEDSLPRIRNDYAHGSATLHNTVLGTFEIVTDLIAQLFVEDI
ncbi:MAG: hypothetical protein PSV26_13535 [Polaromonas sp.]|uniref:hypothetical protein n=1 Tax=Polaromonas sp. TaxID=1869339 RepID=UPI00248A735E|nr:hypothetical protein [Polaromonas sp.]MDI1238498.1 hypothetical protein [Polaromonas sp.]MDI1341601.1 hypothetical protein [Polaromonas sp.]